MSEGERFSSLGGSLPKESGVERRRKGQGRGKRGKNLKDLQAAHSEREKEEGKEEERNREESKKKRD